MNEIAAARFETVRKNVTSGPQTDIVPAAPADLRI